ncbi:MAG: aminoglycoside phosphotransferase family protein [Bacteroidales bacterium]|nr:aminoglycoside phosphotransferase family protein [Bacteroidales bacterium]
MSSAGELENIFKQFRAEGTFIEGKVFGTGHIHDTYKIETGKAYRDYLLQKLNSKVFTDIPGLQENIFRVSNHIRQKLAGWGENDVDRKCLTVIKSHDDRTWFRDQKGDYWRMFIFIPDHHSFDEVKNPMQAYEGGRAIGCFQSLLSDLPGPRLNETIPYFHDVERRLETFHKALKEDAVSRAGRVKDEISFVLARQEEMKIIPRLGKQGKIPLRITHNDTKFNNILFDKDGRALCLIDLDTVMPGYVHYDFGDSIRTAANTAAEDEEDLSKVHADLDTYEAFTRGYLHQISNILNPTEIEYLAFAPSLMTFIMGLRFLTDYIMGDVYYKIHKPDHNILRSRAQFRLIEDFEMKLDRMKSIISDIIK